METAINYHNTVVDLRNTETEWIPSIQRLNAINSFASILLLSHNSIRILQELEALPYQEIIAGITAKFRFSFSRHWRL